MTKTMKNTHKANPAQTAAHKRDTANQEQAAVGSINPAAPAAETLPGLPGNVTSLTGHKGRKVTNMLDGLASELNAKVGEKVTHWREAKQLLAQAKDIEAEGGGRIAEAQNIAARGARLLYIDRAAGLLSADEVSSAMGDIYGYKAKKDGTPSKTPEGTGEALRKRIVRLVQGHDYINGTDFNRFYDGMDKEEVAAVLSRASVPESEGGISIWTAYNELSDIKKAGGSKRVDPAFDTKRIAAIAASLMLDTAADTALDTPGLMQAYVVLRNALNNLGERAAIVNAEREGEEQKQA